MRLLGALLCVLAAATAAAAASRALVPQAAVASRESEAPLEVPTVLVETLDGALHALDGASGESQWRFGGFGALLEVKKQRHFVVNPGDGRIFFFRDPTDDPEIIGSVPEFAVQDLVHWNGFRFIGSKNTIWVELNARTGEVCTADSVTSEMDSARECSENVVQLAQTRYSLKITDASTGEVFWNGTYSRYSILPQLSSADPARPPVNDFFATNAFISAHAGQKSLTFVPDASHKGSEWQVTFESPIFHSYLLGNDRVEAIDLDTNLLSASDIPQIGCDATPINSGEHGLVSVNDGRPGSSSGSGDGPSSSSKNNVVIRIDRDNLAGTVYARPLSANEPTFLMDPSGLVGSGYSIDDDGSDSDDGAGAEIPTVEGEDTDFFANMLHHDFVALIDSPPAIEGPSNGSSDDDLTTSPKRKQQQFWLVLMAFLVISLSVVLYFFHKRASAAALEHERKERELIAAAEAAALAARKLKVDYDAVLGSGSHGTIVYQGEFEGRQVAVKRMLREHFDVAHREVDLLRQSDEHVNVVRYFCMEEDDRFLYIGLELCRATLETVVQSDKGDLSHGSLSEVHRRHLAYDFVSGLAHLHRLSIIHRDVKPQNVLVALKGNRFVAMISDFGLCMKLPEGEVSRHTTSIGTVGWTAPELLLHGRMTRGGDMFSAGCVLHYLATRKHPFGEIYERELRIRKDEPELEPHSPLMDDLIVKLLPSCPEDRLTAEEAVNHPCFWDAGKRLRFLMDVSDRIEKEPAESPLVQALESNAALVVGESWLARIGKDLANDLGKFRKYRPTSVMDLMRAIRNKKHHYMELKPNVKRSLGPLPDGFLDYFESRFPELFPTVYRMIHQHARKETLFTPYFA
eukprot:m.83615 g.83615  ORF g.83615 m.83615 type:complete len:858 (+) comp8307_c0_seq1:286-2859(+)